MEAFILMDPNRLTPLDSADPPSKQTTPQLIADPPSLKGVISNFVTSSSVNTCTPKCTIRLPSRLFPSTASDPLPPRLPPSKEKPKKRNIKTSFPGEVSEYIARSWKRRNGAIFSYFLRFFILVYSYFRAQGGKHSY